MILQSKYLGQLEFADEKIITFEHGLIAFEQKKRYVFIENEDPENPLWWLHSVEDPELVFVVMNPFSVRPDYDFELSAEDVEELGIEKPEDVAVFSIAVVPEDIKKMTVNLLAPVVFNVRLKKGKQIVLQDKKYSTRHFVLEELVKNAAKTPEAGSSAQAASAVQAAPVSVKKGEAQKERGQILGIGKGGCCHAGTD